MSTNFFATVLPDRAIIKAAYTAEVGGGEVATFIETTELTLVIAFGMVGVYTSADAYLHGGEQPVSLITIHGDGDDA